VNFVKAWNKVIMICLRLQLLNKVLPVTVEPKMRVAVYYIKVWRGSALHTGYVVVVGKSLVYYRE
jgi:hypothetical protein